jgi:hypothetical protein
VDSCGHQTIFTNVLVDSVQKMTVLTNAFSAEYGFTAGSVVNMITKGGGSELHGDVFGLFRPSGFGRGAILPTVTNPNGAVGGNSSGLRSFRERSGRG